MAAIPRAVLDYVTAQVNALSADAQARVLAVLESIEWTPDNVARCRELVVEALLMVLPTYTDAAAQAGADMYDAVRVAQVGEALGATATSGFSQEAMGEAVRGFVRFVLRGSVEQFNGQVLERVGREVRRSANVSVAANAARDPLKPRYARVPTGPETCGFCLMLASFGFRYKTEEAASHAHDHCACRVVPDFGGATVEGYDPDGMYGRYKECLDAIGGREQLRRDWNALSEDERAKRIAKNGDKRGDAFDAYVNSRLATEIEMRDPAWFKDGARCSVSKQPGAKPWKKERDVAQIITSNGFNVEFVKEDKEKKTFDAFLNGTAYEFKIPEAYNEKTVKNQFKKAVGKGTGNLLITNLKNGADGEAMCSDIREMLSSDDFTEIDNVLFVDASGRIRRMRR